MSKPKFDARAYWVARAQRMGKTYVARGGRPVEFRKEYDGVAPFLRQAVAGAKSVLDFGCGVQRFRDALESDGATYTGVDHVPTYGTEPLGDSLPLKRYDAAAALFVIQHIVDDELARFWIRQLHNTLVPGGKLILVNYDGLLKRCDAHMACRPIEFVIAAAPWSKVEQLGVYDGHHWIGTLTRGDDDADPSRPPPPPPKIVIHQPAREILSGKPRNPDGPLALVIGGGACVWEDVKALEALLGEPWPGLVIAANDIGCHWPGRLDHWVTLHPEKLAGWLAVRGRNGYNVDVGTWTRSNAPKGGAAERHHKLVPWSGGASGMLGVQAADVLGCSRAILCGVPMTATPHFKESAVHASGRVWGSSGHHWRAWGTLRGRMAGWVTSMSGRTRELLGAPSRAWLFGESPTQPTEDETATGTNNDNERETERERKIAG